MNLELQGEENVASDDFISYCLYFTVRSTKVCCVLSIDLEQTCSTRFPWAQNAELEMQWKALLPPLLLPFRFGGSSGLELLTSPYIPKPPTSTGLDCQQPWRLSASRDYSQPARPRSVPPSRRLGLGEDLLTGFHNNQMPGKQTSSLS